MIIIKCFDDIKYTQKMYKNQNAIWKKINFRESTKRSKDGHCKVGVSLSLSLSLSYWCWLKLFVEQNNDCLPLKPHQTGKPFQSGNWKRKCWSDSLGLPTVGSVSVQPKNLYNIDRAANFKINQVLNIMARCIVKNIRNKTYVDEIRDIM